MFPDFEIFGIGLYDIFIIIGIVVCLAVYRIFSGRTGLTAKVFNFALFTGIFSIACGFLSASLLQSVYNYIASGVWSWLGMTFYGGLIGSVVSFILAYFAVGHFVFKDRMHVKQFDIIISFGLICITVAHAFGRIGCLMNGCCYGLKNEALGIHMWIDGNLEKRLPTQLYEAIFLFILFAVMLYLLVWRKNEYCVSVYMISYGTWRFLIEFIRDDERGSVGISSLTPSQLIALILVALGIALIFFYKYFLKGYFEGVVAKVEKAQD